MEIPTTVFWLWILVNVTQANTATSRRKIRTSKCKYTFVVKEMDTSNCQNSLSQLQADKDTETLDGGPSTYGNTIHSNNYRNTRQSDEIVSWLRNMDKQLVKQLSRSDTLNTTLSKHEVSLNRAEELLGAYRSNFTAVFRMLRYLETSLQEQYEISRNLDNKLSGIMLDMVEVNNVLSKKLPTVGGSVHNKEIHVQSVSKVNSCSVSPEAVNYRDCFDVHKRHNSSGVYFVTPTYAACPIPVWCDMDTTGGGWLLLLRRQNGEISFKHLWDGYKHGFGNIASEFYLGNDNIFLLSNQNFYELRIDLWDFEGNRVYALYKIFKIDGERDNYKLHVHSFSGSARDSLKQHNRMMFSTADHDNDGYAGYDCAREWGAGWWFANCWFAFLTGPYYNTSSVKYRGISWNEWKHEQLAKAEMKIRPSSLTPNSPELQAIRNSP